MKKILTIALASLLCLFFAGCSASDNSSSQAESSQAESSKSESSQSDSTRDEVKSTLSESEINQIINDQIVPNYIADVDDNNRMNEVKSGSEYDYALCPNNHIWVGTKGSFNDDDEIKRWYFFDENHKLYFTFERTAETELRYYVYNDEVIKLIAGNPDSEKQSKYYQGSPEIDQSIISDSYQALSTIN